MVKFRAKNDTYYNFSYIKKGEVIDAPISLRSSVNFECLEEQSAPKVNQPVGDENKNAAGGVTGADASTAPAAPAESDAGPGLEAKPLAEMSYKELCAYGAELGIKVGSITKPDLINKINAKLDEKTDQPVGDENKNAAGGDRTGDDNQ